MRIPEDQPGDHGVIDDPIEVHQRLRALGITHEDILEIARAGFAGRNRCHDTSHPKIAAGFYQWAEMVNAAGVRKSTDGWVRKDYKNVSTIERRDGKVAIGFARGDDGTGNSREDVSTKYPKGPGTLDVVRRNRLNLNLPLDESYIAENERRLNTAGKSLATYLLLYARSGTEWRFELSLPNSINKRTGFVEEWQVRIILPSIPDDPTATVNSTKPVMPNVPVKRRRAG